MNEKEFHTNCQTNIRTTEQSDIKFYSTKWARFKIMSLWLGKAHLQTLYVEAIFYRILLYTYHYLFFNFSRKIKIFHTKFYHRTAEPCPLMMELEENEKLKSIQIDWNWDRSGSNNSSGSRTCDFSTVLSILRTLVLSQLFKLALFCFGEFRKPRVDCINLDICNWNLHLN